MASKGWQHPYVNIFKHVRVDGWKRASKQGDVSTYMDKTLRCPVFRIRGLSPTTSYILVPKSIHQSLGLTGRYFYLLFRPTPGKYFTVHLDVATQEGQVIRISFSNMFREFKSTDTSLQFPFVCGAAKDSVYEATAKTAKQGLVGPAPAKVRWTCLMLDLQHTLSSYLNRFHSHLKSVRLCSNMLVKNIFTSDLLLDPGVSFSEAKLMGLSSLQGTGPMPRDMSFPVPKGNTWHDLYDLIRFPSEGTKLPSVSIQKTSPALEAGLLTDHRTLTRESSSVSLNKAVQDHMPFIPQITSPKPFLMDPSPVVSKLPMPGVLSTQKGDGWSSHNDDQHESESASSHRLISSPCELDNDGVHIYIHPDEDLSHSGDEVEDEFVYTPVPLPVHASLPEDTKQQKLLPDPILRLNRIIGFGGATAKCALWTKTYDAVVYPCHAVIVSMKISSNEQRFFIGHTDQISALAFNGNTTLLASAQIGSCVVRLWNYHKGNCLALFRIQGQCLTCLSFSYNGGILCGVGKDLHGKTMVVVWNTQNVTESGEVTILAKMHSEVDIHTMKVAHFDDTRLVSCGRDNIRLWRVRNGTLRSCLVNLGEYHSMDFSDVAFEEGDSSFQHLDDRTLYASSRSGHVFEIDYSRVAVKNVRRLFPVQKQHAERREKWTFNTGPGIAINSISVSSSFVATGSEDGFLRLWPLDFSAVFLEAEHEGPVSLVSISSDSLQVLAATSTGILGSLDVSSRRYNTLMRSHTDTVLGFSVDGIRRHLTTASSDGSVRIWDMDSLHQLYDFVSEDSPSCVAFHPSEQIFSCGFSSGIIRVFDISNAKLLAEHMQHSGEVVGLIFSPHGDFMYSADSQGSLALYNSSEEDYHVVRTVYNMVAQGTERAPEALTVSTDGRCLAFIGPSEYIVTIADGRSLDELLHVDVSTLDVQSPHLDSALRVLFAPASTDHLLVATSATKILWVSTKTGRLLRQVSNVHKHPCSSLAVSRDCRFLLTAGHNAVKVWDYNMELSVNSQMYIGHSQPINQVGFTSDHLNVVSVGDAIFIWDFLAQPADSDGCSPRRQSNFSTAISVDQTEDISEVHMSIGMPRQSAPLPSSPLTQIVVSPLDHDEQGILRSSPVYDVALTNSSVQLPALLSGPALLSQSRRVPFLKVTQLESGPPMKTNRFGRCKSPEFKCKPLVRPDCYRHFIPRFKTSSVYQDTVVPEPGEEGIKLRAVIGYNGNGRGNMVWSPDQGLFMYSCGCVVVVEYLDTGCQRHLHGHIEEISCLAITNDAKIVASAAGGSNRSTGVICIWDVQTEACRKTLSYHTGAVQSLAFSRDDRFLISVGDFTDPVVVLWNCRTFQMMHSVNESGPIHDVAFSPYLASQLAYVGSEGVHFCLIQSHGLDVDLKVQRVRLPSGIGDAEVTALCYHTESLLFTATNKGHVCAWDVDMQSCFMTWEADKGEIGVLLCRGNRLLTGSNTHWLRLWGVEGVQSVKPQEKVSSIDASGSMAVMEQEIMLDGTVISAAFDSTMDMGIVGTTTGTLWYISWSDNSSIRLVSGHKIKVNDVAFSSDESHFATCSEDGSVRVWSASSHELVVQFQVLSQSCGCVCWSPSPAKESTCVAAGYSDGTLRIFQLSSSEMEAKLHPHQVAVTAVCYSADGHVILTAGRNGLVVVSSPTDRSTIRVLRDHKGAQITSIQCVHEKCKKFGLEGNEMWLAASGDRRVSVWAADWSKGKCDLLDWLTLPAPAYFEDDNPPPSLAAFCPSDPSLVVYTGYGVGKELSFYSLVKKQIIKKIALPHWATCFSLSPESQLIALGSKEGVLKLIKSTSGRFQDFLQHSDSLQTCVFSPSGKLLFTVAYNEILLWEVKGL